MRTASTPTPCPWDRGVDVDVHAGVAVHRIVTVGPLDGADDPPVELDGQHLDVVGLDALQDLGRQVVDVAAPAPVHLRGGADLGQRADIGGDGGAQAHAGPDQHAHPGDATAEGIDGGARSRALAAR